MLEMREQVYHIFFVSQVVAFLPIQLQKQIAPNQRRLTLHSGLDLLRDVLVVSHDQLVALVDDLHRAGERLEKFVPITLSKLYYADSSQREKLYRKCLPLFSPRTGRSRCLRRAHRPRSDPLKKSQFSIIIGPDR